MKRTAVSALALFLAACGSSEPGPGGVTANEAAALDDAAEMAESRRLDDSAVQAPAPAAGSGPAAQPAPPQK